MTKRRHDTTGTVLDWGPACCDSNCMHVATREGLQVDRNGGTDGARSVRVAGRSFQVTPVYDTFWRFAAARQQVYMKRVLGQPGPWTEDPILAAHRFTNAYRASDRVSQYLIQQVIYDRDRNWEDTFLRVLLFKVFNKVSTWKTLVAECGEPTAASFDPQAYDELLTERFARGHRLYSAAYVMAPPALGAARKHTNHLRLLERALQAGVPARVQGAGSMDRAFQELKTLPGVGDFLAYQFLIDLNYSSHLQFDESDFVVPGPGARDGIRKCFGPASRGLEADIIAYMTEVQEREFERLGLPFQDLWGRRLQLIDCQNLFCEVDKYARVAHPNVSGVSGRSRIKQRFTATIEAVTSWFPPKWGLNDRLPSVQTSEALSSSCDQLALWTSSTGRAPGLETAVNEPAAGAL